MSETSRKSRGPLAILFTSVLAACASSPPPTSAPTRSGPEAKEDENQAAVTPSTPAPSPVQDPQGVQLEPAPISIPNARFYEGYVLGGLPSEQQIDAALAAGFESAMSLMAKDEEGGPELARYGASKGLRYLRFTIAGKEDLNESMAWQFASTESMLGKPAIIHCSSGQRVAAIFALRAYFVNEASADEALALGDALGMGEYAEHVRQVVADNPR